MVLPAELRELYEGQRYLSPLRLERYLFINRDHTVIVAHHQHNISPTSTSMNMRQLSEVVCGIGRSLYFPMSISNRL